MLQVASGVDINSLSEIARSMIMSSKGDTLLNKMDEAWRDLQVTFATLNTILYDLLSTMLTSVPVKLFFSTYKIS